MLGVGLASKREFQGEESASTKVLKWVGVYLAHVRKCNETVWLEWAECEAVLWRMKSEK